ncbi:hypothetical protein SCBWM1_gp86 [Synechococcus phage S-CBWM1]|uniref:Uncharacterized protein n=1 Tax=Synechococcus phage S-CBWM1 TaxID=2053653 RepID=A0A3G1L3Q1_9CAUD|nr:hypothetical protein HOU61_gp111 [Synechococcus phage S-CBWM1]ATW62770.1 hypothetical protein SCBWM1_gp86 [Synechococcus phage S-CBWM1]
MAILRGKIADIQTIPSSTGVLYANPASTGTFVGGITLHNTSGVTETVELFNVPDDSSSVGTASLSHRFLKVELVADSTVSYLYPGDGIPLTDTNDTIQGVCTTAGKVTVMFSGPKQV